MTRRLIAFGGWARPVVAGAAAALTAAALAAAAVAAPLTQPPRTVGITVSTNQSTDASGRVTEALANLDRWDAAMRTRVGIVASFVSWGSGVDPVAFAKAVAGQGDIPLITWESWQPAATGDIQPSFSNAQIAEGRWDAYIRRVARGLKALNHLTYIRFDHEMNGDWYPWHQDAAAYVRAWRHVVSEFRKEGTANVKWIWAPNATSWTTKGWLDSVRPYWPGGPYVDYVGLTVQQQYAKMEMYGQHLDLIHATWPQQQVALPETNAMTPSYMHELVAFVRTRPWIRNVTWYERPAFGTLLERKAMAAEFGQLAWRTSTDYR